MSLTHHSVRDASRHYVQQGFAVVPNAAREKYPYLKGWQNLRIGVDEIDQFFRPNDNTGIILGQPSGGLVCADLDDETAVALASQYLPATGMIAGRKQGGKTHWFYYVAGTFEKVEFKHEATNQKFIEILGDGQQVVVGPSVHPSGDIYDDLTGDPAEIDSDDLIDAVGRLFEAVCDAKGLDPYEGREVDESPSTHVNGIAQSSDATRPGDDYNERGDVRDLLLKHGWKSAGKSGNRERWTRPGKAHGTSGTLTEGKVFFVFSSSTGLDSRRGYSPFCLYAHLEHSNDFTAAARELGRQGYGKQPDKNVDLSGIVNSDGRVQDIDSIPAAPVPESIAKMIIPADMLNPGGLLQEIIDFNLATAIKRQPELALAGAIALVATIIGRKVEDDYNVRSNIMLVGLASSGAGKDHGRKVNKSLLALAGAEAMFQDDLASAAGLHVALNVSPSTLIQLDEFGRFMATMGNPGKHPWLYAILTVLLKLYSSSGSVYKGPVYADVKRNVVVHYPNVTMFGTTVPGSFFASLTKECLSDGSLNRWLVVEASNNDPDLSDPFPFCPGEDLVESIRWWVTYRPEAIPTARRLVSTPAAKELFKAHAATVRDRQREEESRGTQVWGRCYENARKLALIHQCSLDCGAMEISGASADWGCRLAFLLTQRIDVLAAEHIADGEFDALAKKLHRFIREAGDGGRTRTEVCRHMRAQNNRQLDELVQKLTSTEEIIFGTRPVKSGPATTVYKAIG